MHASVVSAPRLMRMAALARSGATPMAESTCDGEMLPLWHADPAEHATPRRSSAMSMDSLSTPGTETLVMCGARGAPRPWITASGMRARKAASCRSRRASRDAHSCSRSATASSAARARPTAMATFSVPGRRPRSCAPPNISGSIGVPRRMYSAPMPLGAPILWPDNESMSKGCVRASIAILPKACTASVWKTAPRAFARAARRTTS